MKKFAGILLLLCVGLLPAQVSNNALLKVFDAAFRQTPNKNLLLSPWGIQQCFGMVYGGAGQVSAAELERVLGINAQAVRELQSAAQSLKNTAAKFNSFNAILFSSKYVLQKSFIKYAMNECGGKLYRVDFARKDECVKLLNDIVRRETFNMFDNVFTPQPLSGDPVMVLLNVLYFKARWMNDFDKESTRKERFSIPAKGFEALTHKQVDMMNDSRYLPYYNDGKVHGIILDYADRRFKLLLLTTLNALKPVSEVTSLLAEKGIQYFVKKSSSGNKTIIKLPKLKISGEVDLKDLFGQLGMKNIFDPQIGDLGRMVEQKVLYISKAKQLVKLNLDENGTEVAAVTYAVAECASAPPGFVQYNRFYADHPFAAVLFDSKTNAVLLAGVIVDPEK